MPRLTAGGVMTCARIGRSRYVIETDTMGLSFGKGRSGVRRDLVAKVFHLIFSQTSVSRRDMKWSP